MWWLFKQLTGKEGMGHGDFKLLAALGAWVGLQGILPTILLSSLVGAIVGSIWLAVKGRDRATPIPFGPYLAVAGWIVFFWGATGRRLPALRTALTRRTIAHARSRRAARCEHPASACIIRAWAITSSA